FPNLTWSMAQIYPFKRKRAVGKELWYEKIKLSYNGQFNNSLTAQQDEFLKKSLIKDWRNGFNHSMPISATFTALTYLNITPSLKFNDRMYTQRVKRMWDPNAAAEVMDTSYSFYNVFDFTTSLSFDTKVYGFYRPIGFLGKRVKMIRHVMTPTVSFSYNPDFSNPMWGIYGRYSTPAPNGESVERVYSMFPNALFGVPSAGKRGTMTYSLANNLEMKTVNPNDSTAEEKKVSLIENLQLSQSYNMAADSLRFSNINSSILIRLSSKFNLNLSAVWDVYCYGVNSYGTPVRINKLRIANGKGLGRLSSTGTSFNYNFNNDTFRKLAQRFRKKKEGEEDDDTSASSSSSNNKGTEVDPDGYLHWDCPWNLSFNYSVNYGYGEFDFNKMEYKGKITQNLSLSGNIRPTPAWNFSFSASYDFDKKKIAYMNCNISRDLHCFTMT
ncbi:MAG: LPS-assembly protein LptD, partial [Paramuribaculum sp.]|nr:LPS-assembly protein LptD [Paramuribaculum sp.]